MREKGKDRDDQRGQPAAITSSGHDAEGARLAVGPAHGAGFQHVEEAEGEEKRSAQPGQSAQKSAPGHLRAQPHTGPERANPLARDLRRSTISEGSLSALSPRGLAHGPPAQRCHGKRGGEQQPEPPRQMLVPRPAGSPRHCPIRAGGRGAGGRRKKDRGDGPYHGFTKRDGGHRGDPFLAPGKAEAPGRRRLDRDAGLLDPQKARQAARASLLHAGRILGRSQHQRDVGMGDGETLGGPPFPRGGHGSGRRGFSAPFPLRIGGRENRVPMIARRQRAVENSTPIIRGQGDGVQPDIASDMATPTPAHAARRRRKASHARRGRSGARSKPFPVRMSMVLSIQSSGRGRNPPPVVSFRLAPSPGVIATLRPWARATSDVNRRRARQGGMGRADGGQAKAPAASAPRQSAVRSSVPVTVASAAAIIERGR